MSERNYLHDIERHEYLDALNHELTPCYRHSYVPDQRGGGVCTDCGDTLSRSEL